MKKIYLLFISIFSTIIILAQSVIYIQPNAVITIQENALLQLDGLTLTPDKDLSLSNTSLLKTTTTAHTININYVNRIYRFTDNIPVFSGKLRISYTTEELNNLPATGLFMRIYNGSQWLPYRDNTGSNSNDNFVETTLPNAVSLHELILTANHTALPLVWGLLNGVCQNNLIQLKWETLQESNTKEFIIERSSNGNTWTYAQQLDAVGNSTSKQQYTITDKPSQQVQQWFYRIKSVDMDGTFSYSAIIKVASCSATDKPSLAPVPVRNYTNLSMSSNIAGNAAIIIYDATGKTINSMTSYIQEGQNTISINTSKLNAGIYYLKIVLANKNYPTIPFTKIH